MPALLLDTCAAIWLANGEALKPAALRAITDAATTGGVFVSAVTAWEIGLLSRNRAGPRFLPDAQTWLRRLIAAPGLREAPLSAEIALASSYLPGAIHGDPADRLLVATARALGLPIVTRDRRLIDYAEGGFVQVLVC